MKKWIRNLVGVTELFGQLVQLRHELMMLKGDIGTLQDTIAPPLATLASALFDEHSKARKAASDLLTNRAIEKAKAEDKARRHTLGEL